MSGGRSSVKHLHYLYFIVSVLKHLKTFLFPIGILGRPLATQYCSATKSVFDFSAL